MGDWWLGIGGEWSPATRITSDPITNRPNPQSPLLSASRSQPRDHFLGVLVGRKDRVEDMFDPAIANDQREPLDQRHALDGKGRKFQRMRKGQVFVAEHLERH